MAENKLAELSMDFAVEVLKMCNNLFRYEAILRQGRGQLEPTSVLQDYGFFFIQ